MNIKVYDSKEATFDNREMSISELPLIPDWFNERLLEIAGESNGFPNLRVVSGLDPDIQEWTGGRWWRKYAFREHIVNEYYMWHKPDGTKKILSPKEGEVLRNSKNLKGIIIPVFDRKVIEYGIPRYFVEYYRLPEYFGTEESWEAVRYDEDESGNKVDLMGEFPRQGSYETWFCIEEAIEEDGKITGTKYRELDEVVLELIKFELSKKIGKSAAEQHAENRKEIDEEYLQHKVELKDRIRDIVKTRIDRLVY